MRKLRDRLTYANVMVTLLAFVVLGGVAYAATELPANSVGTAQLKAGAVTKGKIAKATREALRGQTGPQGSQGPIGPQGPSGEQGPPGAAATDPAGFQFARIESVPLEATSYGAASGLSKADSFRTDVELATPFNAAIEVRSFAATVSSPMFLFCTGAGTCKLSISLVVGETTTLLNCQVVGVSCIATGTATIPAGSQFAVRLFGVETTGTMPSVMVTWRSSPA